MNELVEIKKELDKKDVDEDYEVLLKHKDYFGISTLESKG